MINKPAIITLLAFSLCSVSMADTFAEMDMEANAKAAHIELDAETGSCLTELREHNQRAAKMLDVLRDRKKQITTLENKVASLQSKLETKPAPAKCDTSSLQAQIAQLQSSNATTQSLNTQLSKTNNALQASLGLSKSENEQLKKQVASLQENLQLAKNSSNTNDTLITAELQASRQENDALRQQISALENDLLLAKSSPALAAKAPATGSKTSGKAKRLNVHTVNASSRYGNNRHYAKHLIDGKPSTTWVSANKKTSGQSLKLNLEKEETVTRFYISIPEYKYGFPPKSANLYFSDGTSQAFALTNKWGKQRFTLDPVKTDYVEVEFGEMSKPSPSNSYSYIQVSEIELYGY